MAQKEIQLDIIRCSICLDLLKDPVSLNCGHNYCTRCINEHWDGEDHRLKYSCPQCREVTAPRPSLKKNTMLADLVEQLKTKTELQTAPFHQHYHYAGPEDVACDYCTGKRKLKAFKSCLICLNSYCEKHLELYHESQTAFENHTLVEPSKKLHENIFCSQHNEVMKIFCRTDRKLICYLCLMDDHKCHETVSAASERSTRQKELEKRRENIQKSVQVREREVKALQKKFHNINRSAKTAVRHSEEIFNEVIDRIRKKSSEITQHITSKQEIEVKKVKDFQQRLNQEITELKKEDVELKRLSRAQDHNFFLESSFSSFSHPSGPTTTSGIKIKIIPPRYFEDVTAAVAKNRDEIHHVMTQTWERISQMGLQLQTEEEEEVGGFLPSPRQQPSQPIATTTTTTRDDVNLLREARESESTSTQQQQQQQQPQHQPTRADFLKYSREITLDPNTAHQRLFLTEGNRCATLTDKQLFYPSHRDRFTGSYCQVLSKQSLTATGGRWYWEVEWRGKADIAVTYKTINRTGDESEFGYSSMSWSLDCGKNSYKFWHDKAETRVSGPHSSRIGVYVDYSSGVLSFYSVSLKNNNMKLIHTVHTKFTQPLYAGVRLFYDNVTVEICKLK